MKKHIGFTLLELVIVMVLISIMAAMSSRLILQGVNSYTKSQTISTTDWQGSYALDHMTREIRSLDSSSDITTATASQFSFTDGTNTAITYQVTGGNLVEGANTLASNASSVVFTYYDRSGAVTSTVNLIRFVQIVLTLTNSNYTYAYKTTVYLANLP